MFFSVGRENRGFGGGREEPQVGRAFTTAAQRHGEMRIVPRSTRRTQRSEDETKSLTAEGAENAEKSKVSTKHAKGTKKRRTAFVS
jgi:hypothetical protein